MLADTAVVPSSNLLSWWMVARTEAATGARFQYRFPTVAASPERPEVIWAQYSPPTPADVSAGLLALRQDGSVTAARARDHYALLHLLPATTPSSLEERAARFVVYLRWTIGALSLDDETAIIATWSLFPPGDPGKISTRHEAARAEIIERLPPRPGEAIRDYSAKMISDRERAFLQMLAHRLVNNDNLKAFLTHAGIAGMSQPPRDPSDGTNVRWDEWRIVLDRRADPVEQYCYYNVNMEAVRTLHRFHSVAYTSGDPSEPDDPIRLISTRCGHQLLKPVLDAKPLQRSQLFIDAVYFGRTLSIGDIERVKYCRTLYKDVGEESWVSLRTLGGSDFRLDMRILLDPAEQLKAWREEIWSSQSPDAELLHRREYSVGAVRPKLVRYFVPDAKAKQLHRLIIVP